MNVDEVLDTVEQTLLSRQLRSLERFILCQSWLGRDYSEMAPECAYSIAHIKDIGAQLWQALSQALGERVTKKNLFLVLKQYWLSMTGETVASDQRKAGGRGQKAEGIYPDAESTSNLSIEREQGFQAPAELCSVAPVQEGFESPSERNLLPSAFHLLPSQPLSVPLELVEVIDAPLTPITERLPVATDLVEPSYSEDSEQLPRKSDRVELVTGEDERLERGLQEYQTSCDRIETENNLKAPVTQSQLSIPSTHSPLDSSLYINHLLIAEIPRGCHQLAVEPYLALNFSPDEVLN